MGPQYALLRFEKHQGNPAGSIEAHHERQKETYASNPDVHAELSKYNFHIIRPESKYHAEIQKRIEAAGCRTRKDSVRFVDTLVTASPEFFKEKKPDEVKAFFQRAAEFLTGRLGQDNFISAVVHMDEKTPHMHLVFVPLTKDKRLCAKEIIGNRKRLIQWQDDFWTHMAGQYPDLERGESASETGRDHIPTRVYKEMAHLNKQRLALKNLISEANAFNAKSRITEIGALLDKYIPDVEQMQTKLKKYKGAFKALSAQNDELAAQNERLAEEAKENKDNSVLKKLKEMQLQRDYVEALRTLERIPPEVLKRYQQKPHISEKEVH